MLFLAFFLMMGVCLYGDAVQQEQKNISSKKIERKIVLDEVTDNFYAVEQGKLYRSSQLVGEKLAQYIKTYGIKTIINLRGEKRRAWWWKSEKEECDKLGVNLVNIKMSSSHFPSKQQILTLLDMYDTADTPMIIHCYSGVNRTGQAAALWILEKQGGSREQALEQFDEKYGYDESLFPTKKLFIQEVWQGREWLEKNYNPKKITALYNNQKKQKTRTLAIS